MDVLKAMDEPAGPPDPIYPLPKGHGRPKGRKYAKQDARAFQKRVEKRRAKKARR